MRTATSRVLVLVSLAVVASGCDSTRPPEPRIALSLSTSSVAIAQGGREQITVTIERTNFENPVALSIQGATPAGVTTQFALTSLPTGTTNTTLTIDVAGNAPPTASTTLTVRATGEGIAEQTQPITLSIAVTGNYTLGLAEPSLRVAQGGGGTATVLLTRTGGNAGDVNLSVGSLPSGVTAAFAPSSTTRDATSLVLSASGGVPTGTFPVTITSASPGLTPDQTTTLTVEVLSPPATASVTIPFCASSVPSWFAYKNEGFHWQQLSPTGNAFTFNATERVSVAYVYTTNGSSFTTYHMTRSELSAFSTRGCRGTRTYTGTVAGLAAGQVAVVVMGVAIAVPNSNTPTYSLANVAEPPLDLVAARGVITAQTFPAPDRVIIRRNVDLPSGGTIPELNFTATEAFAPVSTNLTVSNVPANATITFQNSLLTPTTTYGIVQLAQTTTTPVSLYSVPTDRMIAGDLHELYLDSDMGSSGQAYVDYTTAVADRTVALGPTLSVPSLSRVASSPYSRLRVMLPSQSEYNTVAVASFLQASFASAKLVTTVATAAFLGGTPANWDLGIPDFSGASGFDNSWMLSPGLSTSYSISAYGGREELLFGAAPVAGDMYRLGYRSSSTQSLAAIRARPEIGRVAPPRPQYFSR